MQKFSSKTKNLQKGVSLIITFLVMTIITAAVLSISTILFNKIKITADVGNSVPSYYTAMAGVEKTLYFDKKQLMGQGRGFCQICTTCKTDANDPSGDPATHCNNCVLTPLAGNGCNISSCNNCQLTYSTVFNGRTQTVSATVTPDALPGKSDLNISSTGLYKNVTRTINSLFVSDTPSPIDPTLVGYWKFDETSGLTANDSTGNGRTGTLVNGVAYSFDIPSVSGNLSSLSFDGVNDQISFTAINTTNTFTYTAWIKPNSQTIAYGSIFSDSAGSLGLWYLGGASRKVTYYYGGNHTNTTAFSDGVWQHIAVVNNGGSVTFYRNGVADGVALSAPSFSFSRIGNDNLNEAFKGLLDDVRLYNRALSPSEIATIAAGS